MAGKTNTSATFFAQKKLLGKGHTSNLKTDGEELIGSNIQAGSSLIFGETIPVSASLDLYTIQSASDGGPGTIEYIPFVLTAITGTTYDANSSNPDGGSGTDTGESSQVAGPHAYKFVLPSNYESNSSNTRAGNDHFKNSRIVHETLGKVQLVPPFFSQEAPNPYIVKIYKDDGGGGVGDEIPLLDNIDWNVDYYNGILFLQDYNASKIPAHARAFAYVGKMAEEVISSASNGGGGEGTPGGSNTQVQFNDGGSFAGDSAFVFNSTTDTLTVSKLSGSITRLTDGKSFLVAGSGVSIQSASNGQITISSTVPSARFKRYQSVTASHASNNSFYIDGIDFSLGGFSPDYIDVFVNGQLMLTGSQAQVSSNAVDYTIAANKSDALRFAFALDQDDIIAATVFQSGSS